MCSFSNFSCTILSKLIRAYVVHAKPQKLSTDIEKHAFTRVIFSWIQTKVARHKFLRGGMSCRVFSISVFTSILGVVVIDVVPKR